MSDAGYARAYRKRWSHKLFRNRQEAAVWAWMCDCAAWRDVTFRTQWGAVTLKRGQILLSERKVAEDFGMHRNTLRRLIHAMTDDGMVTPISGQSPKKAGTIYAITKYEEYQGLQAEQANTKDHSGTSEGTLSGPLRDHCGTKKEEEEELEYIEESKGDAPDGAQAGLGLDDGGNVVQINRDKQIVFEGETFRVNCGDWRKLIKDCPHMNQAEIREELQKADLYFAGERAQCEEENKQLPSRSRYWFRARQWLIKSNREAKERKQSRWAT